MSLSLQLLLAFLLVPLKFLVSYDEPPNEAGQQ